MPNTLNARIGRSTPSPANLYAIETPQAEDERITLRRRPADRGSLVAIKSLCRAAYRVIFRVHSQQAID
ncbi:MAG TPA: hypothetical protein VE421_01085 [Burkholderiaceae bacterium]|nr:hypothetical protein [Burkholderiaceae bacterium]